MAYERLSQKKILAINLGSFIESQILLIAQLRLRHNLEDETRFTQAVLEDNLTLEQQLKYRKDQLKRVMKGDTEERLRIRKEISTLKNLMEQDEFNNAYLGNLLDLNSGIQSIETTMNWLRNRLKNTTDLTIQRQIKDNLNQLATQRYTQQKTAMESQTSYAKESKIESVVSTQIENVNKARIKAVESGNDDYVALLDLQLQTLNKSMSEAVINKTMMDFSVATMTGQSSISLLNQFNLQVESADPQVSITIGGIRYDSAQIFWELKRGEYLNDRTANGFFLRYQTELNEKVEYKRSRGVLQNTDFEDVKNWHEILKDRPEMADYQNRIAQDQQSSLQTTANSRAQNILNEYAIKLDAKKAISDLSYIQDTYGVDQTSNVNKLKLSAGAEKQAQVESVLRVMRQDQLDNPGFTQQQYLERAISTGAGVSISPEEFATKKASELIPELGEKAVAQQFKEEEPAITISPEAEGKTFAQQQFTEGGLYKLPTSPTVWKYEGGKLRGFTGQWEEAQFKQAAGKGFAAVQTVPNIAGVPQGEAIKAADFQPRPEEAGEQIVHPGLLEYYKPEEIITKGQEKYLKSGVKRIWGERVGATQWGQMQQQYDPATLEKKVVRAGEDIYLRQ